MNSVITIITAIIGTVGFSLLFGLNPKLLGYAALGGGISWSVYLLYSNFVSDNVFLCCFFSTIAVAVFVSILSSKIEVPTIILLAPSVLPVVPGSDLYYSFLYLYKTDWSKFLLHGKNAVLSLFAISMGMTIVYFVKSINYNLRALKKTKQTKL